MHRFYVPPEDCTGTALRLEGREAHHALHVLRLQRGEVVAVLDGVGHELVCEAQAGRRDQLELLVRKKKFIPRPSFEITLLQALPKGKIIETIIQKAVELGAHRIVPLLTEHVVAQYDAEDAKRKQEKWRQVAIEAIKQCGAPWLPEIEAPAPLAAVLARTEPFDLALVGSLQTERRHPRQCFLEYHMEHGRWPQSVAVWIGPEGDFTREELKAIAAGGALPVTLGSLTLRVETAAVYCLSILGYELSSKDL